RSDVHHDRQAQALPAGRVLPGVPGRRRVLPLRGQRLRPMCPRARRFRAPPAQPGPAVTFPIREATPLAATVTRYVVEAPLVARKRQAGHFVIVRVAEGGERIPLTIVDGDAATGTITLIVQAVGKTTRQMAALRAGDALADVLGPLGNPTPIAVHGAVACVGGGVGTAELLPIARALRA